MGSPEELPREDLEDLYENAPCGYLSMRRRRTYFQGQQHLLPLDGVSRRGADR